MIGSGPGLGTNVKKPKVVDILPTVLHQLGLRTPRGWNIDGHSLSPRKPPSSASAAGARRAAGGEAEPGQPPEGARHRLPPSRPRAGRGDGAGERGRGRGRDRGEDGARGPGRAEAPHVSLAVDTGRAGGSLVVTLRRPGGKLAIPSGLGGLRRFTGVRLSVRESWSVNDALQIPSCSRGRGQGSRDGSVRRRGPGQGSPVRSPATICATRSGRRSLKDSPGYDFRRPGRSRTFADEYVAVNDRHGLVNLLAERINPPTPRLPPARRSQTNVAATPWPHPISKTRSLGWMSSPSTTALRRLLIGSIVPLGCANIRSCPTSSSTATPPTRSSTAPRTRWSWPRRRPSRAMRRWR